MASSEAISDVDEERRRGHLIMEAINGVVRGNQFSSATSVRNQWRHQRQSVASPEAISGVIRGHQWRHQRPSVLISHLRSQRGHAAVGMRRPN